jgi:hypothetical protein
LYCEVDPHATREVVLTPVPLETRFLWMVQIPPVYYSGQIFTSKASKFDEALNRGRIELSFTRQISPALLTQNLSKNSSISRNSACSKLCPRDAMNCPKCHNAIYYRFSTSCLSCDCELVQAIPSVDLIKRNDRPLSFRHYVGGGVMIFATAAIGMIIGAVVVYVLAGTVYLAIYPHGVTNGDECARGTAVAWLSLIGGALFGCGCGAILAARILLNRY